jgi:hypothetical protein
MAYDNEGDLIGDAAALSAVMTQASEGLRGACHLARFLAADEMEPADWSAQVAKLPEIIGRLDSLLEILGRKYHGLTTAYGDRQVRADDQTNAQACAAGVMLSLAAAKRGLEGPARHAQDAHNKAARLYADGERVA